MTKNDRACGGIGSGTTYGDIETEQKTKELLLSLQERQPLVGQRMRGHGSKRSEASARISAAALSALGECRGLAIVVNWVSGTKKHERSGVEWWDGSSGSSGATWSGPRRKRQRAEQIREKYRKNTCWVE